MFSLHLILTNFLNKIFQLKSIGKVIFEENKYWNIVIAVSNYSRRIGSFDTSIKYIYLSKFEPYLNLIIYTSNTQYLRGSPGQVDRKAGSQQDI